MELFIERYFQPFSFVKNKSILCLNIQWLLTGNMFQGSDIERLLESTSLLIIFTVYFIIFFHDFKTLLDNNLVSSQFQIFLLNTTVLMFDMILTKM
jgi:hypothetical protein